MPQTRTYQAYKFDELSDRAKERARDWWRQGGFDHEWWDSTYEDAQQCLELVGFDIRKIYFSGFSSQGDGACFEGRWEAGEVQPGKLKEHAPQDKVLHGIANDLEELAAAYPEMAAKIRHRGHYYHPGCTEIETEWHNEDDLYGDAVYESPAWNAVNNKLREAREAFEEAARDAMRWIYRQLEAQYDWLNADEQVDDAIRANEYLFTEDGKRTVVL
jgi:hypothetical protein